MKDHDASGDGSRDVVECPCKGLTYDLQRWESSRMAVPVRPLVWSSFETKLSLD